MTQEMAKAAESAMDGKKLDGLHTLVAKIADPDAKKARSGPQNEGREIIVKNLDRQASEAEIREMFGQHGEIERVNIVKLVNNRPTGTVFIVYANSDGAKAAVEAAHNKPWKDRIMRVEIVQPKGRAAPEERARHEDILVKKAPTSASPEPTSHGSRRGSDVSMQSGTKADEETHKTARERKVAIFNIPDTVNDARIRSAMETYGPINKIQLRRERSGAIVEFVNVQDAFRVRSGVDVSGLGPDARTGDVSELLSKGKGKTMGERGGGGGRGGAPLRGSPMFRIRAPGSGPDRRRGGLGFRRGPGFVPASSMTPTSSSAEGAKKGNDDFRRMLEASKGEARTKDEEAKAKEESKKEDSNGDV
jgi:hypothetical protein